MIRERRGRIFIYKKKKKSKYFVHACKQGREKNGSNLNICLFLMNFGEKKNMMILNR